MLDPFMVTEEECAPLVEFERAALCRRDDPAPFEDGFELPFEVLSSPGDLILAL